MADELVIRRRIAYGNRDFVEMVWRVPTSEPPSNHGFKYRLVYIVDGRRVLGFDNERGKGAPRHDGDHEEPYQFTSIEELVSDFIRAVSQWRSDHGKT